MPVVPPSLTNEISEIISLSKRTASFSLKDGTKDCFSQRHKGRRCRENNTDFWNFVKNSYQHQLVAA